MSGYFKIHRRIFDSWIFADDKAFKIWVWLIGKASYKKVYVPLKIGKGVVTVELNKGQLIFGRSKAEEALFLDGSLIYRKLKKMEEDNMIKIDSNNQYSIVTICNYEEYQLENEETEQPTHNQRTTNEQQANSANSRRTAGEHI